MTLIQDALPTRLDPLTQKVASTDLSTEMQTTMLDERKRPKIRKKEQIRQTKSPAHQDTVRAQLISNGIIRKVTYRKLGH